MREFTLFPMSFFSRKSKPVTLFTYFSDEIELCNINKRFGTARNYQNTLSSLRHFFDGEDIPLGSLTPAVVADYEKWLLLRGINRNSTSFYMRNLRCVYNKAVKSGLAKQCDLFTSVYTGIDRTRKRALDEAIITRLVSLDLRHAPSLALSRDLFVFSFYARGMSYVDIAYLKKSDISNGVLTYIRRKTNCQLTVRIEPCMRTIINRYRSATKGSVYVFPIIKSSDPSMAHYQYRLSLNYHNEKLKILSKKIGETSIITSYTARHTWATTARRHNIPISIISAGMGHTTEKTTQIYLAPFEDSVIDDANKSLIDVLKH